MSSASTTRKWQAAAEAVKNIAQKQENAAATVERLAGALDSFMQLSVQMRSAHERGITSSPQAKISAALLSEKLEAASQRWIEAESLLPTAFNRARLPFIAAAAIVHIEVCDWLWRARLPALCALACDRIRKRLARRACGLLFANQLHHL